MLCFLTVAIIWEVHSTKKGARTFKASLKYLRSPRFFGKFINLDRTFN